MNKLMSAKDHSLAIKEDGTVVAWGLDHCNQCVIPIDLEDV